MKRSRTRTIDFRRKYVTKDGEGVPTVTYGSPITMIGEVWPATDALQAQTYGDRIRSIMNMRIKGKYEIIQQDNDTIYLFDDLEIREGDGVCINSEDADYRIISIKPYKPIRMEIEKI